MVKNKKISYYKDKNKINLFSFILTIDYRETYNSNDNVH